MKNQETLSEYSCVYLTQTSGLDAEKTSALRRACFKDDIKMLCVKNTLLKKAFEASETDYSELYDLLHGETTLLLSNTGNAPAKLIKKFRQKNDTLPLLKGCIRRGDCICWRRAQLDTLSNIKSKNELIADVIGSSPESLPRTLSAHFRAAPTKLHGILETLSNKEN